MSRERKQYRTAWSTNPTAYTILYRRKGSRMYYRCGYRSESIGDIRDLAYSEIREGKYAAAKIVNADTNELIEKVV